MSYNIKGVETKSRRPPVIIEDMSTVAFMKLRGHQITPVPKDTGNGVRIAFEISGDGIEESFDAYHGNQYVGIQDYLKNVRSIRAMLFELKHK